MSTDLDFNRVTFGLPVEAFRIDAYITKDERLPVVTEYVLRALRICEALTPTSLRDFFGFTDAEALTVVESLSRQGLLTVEGGEVRLSAYAMERFDASSSDEYPRFTKVEPRRDAVTLDLLSFSPLSVPRFGFMTENSLRLDTPEEAIGSSVERARRTYTTRFSEIAQRNDGLRDSALSVYSVEDVQSRRRGYVPVPVTLSIGENGQVERQAARNFEEGAAPELLQAFHEAVSSTIPTTLSISNSLIAQFIETFDLQWLGGFLTGKRFDISNFAHKVVAGDLTAPRGVKPLFGNLYIERNLEQLTERIEGHRTPRRSGPTITYGVRTSAAWLAPQHFLWGRGEAFQSAVSKLRAVLQSEGTDDLHIFAPTELQREREVASQFTGIDAVPLHAYRPDDLRNLMLGGRLELFLYPTGVAVALFHLSLQDGPGMWAPVGFLSTQHEHCAAVHKLLLGIAGGQQYGGRLDRAGKAAGAPQSFDSACGFLQFSPYRPKQAAPEAKGK